MNNEDLRFIQRETGLTDIKISERLGITREHYNHVKNGKYIMSSKLVMAVLEKFPEFFLDKDSTKIILNNTAILSSATHHQTPPGQKSGVLRILRDVIKDFLIRRRSQ